MAPLGRRRLDYATFRLRTDRGRGRGRDRGVAGAARPATLDTGGDLA